MCDPPFSIEPISANQIDPCYAIVRIALPWIDLRRWRMSVRHTLAAHPSRRGAITVRRRGRQFPCGVACYRCETDLEHGWIMMVRPLAAIDPLDNAPLLAALAHRLNEIAREAGCKAIRVVAQDPETCLHGFGGTAHATKRVHEHTFLL